MSPQQELFVTPEDGLYYGLIGNPNIRPSVVAEDRINAFRRQVMGEAAALLEERGAHPSWVDLLRGQG